jgi:hypothetical protein
MEQDREIPVIAAILREMQDGLKKQNELMKKLLAAKILDKWMLKGQPPLETVIQDLLCKAK